MKEKIRETVREIVENEVKTPAVGYFWKGLAIFLLGVIIGFTFAPIKKGIKIGCNNSSGKDCSKQRIIAAGTNRKIILTKKRNAAEISALTDKSLKGE